MGSYGLEFARSKSNRRKKIAVSKPVCFYMTFAFWRRKNSWFWLEKFASFQPDKDAVLSQKVVDASQTRRFFLFGGMGGVGVFLVGAFRGWSPLAWHDIHMQGFTKIIIFFFRRKFLWQVFRWGAHFFWIFEYTFFFVQVVFWNVVHFVSTLVIWWGRLYRCFGLLNSLRSFVGGFLGWCPAPPFYPGGICGRPCKQFGDLTAFLETFLLGF